MAVCFSRSRLDRFPQSGQVRTRSSAPFRPRSSSRFRVSPRYVNEATLVGEDKSARTRVGEESAASSLMSGAKSLPPPLRDLEVR
jgi:hypothetical protein